jgi:hypothetical protein
LIAQLQGKFIPMRGLRFMDIARSSFLVIPIRSIGLALLLGLIAITGCQKQPYACVSVSGKITYEDGSLIPAEQIRLTFLSQTPPKDPKISPRAGAATVDGKTGMFDSVSTYVPKDGLIAGEHKVLVQCYVAGRMRMDLTGNEYANAANTPLTANTSKLPLELKVRKPASAPRAK